MLSYDILREKPTLFQVFTTLTQAEFLDLLVEFKRQWSADKQKRSKQSAVTPETHPKAQDA